MLQYDSKQLPLLQQKLNIGQPGDKYEKEADAVADRVMKMGDNGSLRMQPFEEEEEELQTKIRMQVEPVEEEEEPLTMKCADCKQAVSLHMQPEIQMAPKKQRWGGREGSKWAPLPWTYDELRRMKAAELKHAKTEKAKKLLDQKYFRGEQVIKHWNNRYGKWEHPLTDPWAQWFKSNMKEFGKFSYYPDKLWQAFLKRRAESASPWRREVAINPFWPEKDKVRYELYKDELESRDPTSIEFFKSYSKFINPEKPYALVDPPKKAQKFLIDSPYAKPMSNKELRTEIKRLRKVLKLDK